MTTAVYPDAGQPPCHPLVPYANFLSSARQAPA